MFSLLLKIYPMEGKAGVQYTQLTEDERIEIYALTKAGFSKRAIARQLKRDPKTIREEIARNTKLKAPITVYCKFSF